MSLLLLFACAGPDPVETGKPTDDTAPTDSESDTDADADSDTDVDADSDTDADTDSDADVDTGPFDADLDGYDTTTDCDDTDPTSHPGATESCDGVDHDCDGEILVDGICGEVQPVDALARNLVDDGASAYPAGDMTGDGLPDWMYAGLPVIPNPDGGVSYGVALYPGGSLPISPVVAPAGSLHTWAVNLGCVLEGWPQPVGDLDGDGLDDLILLDTACDHVLNIHLSPETPGTEWWHDTEVTWTAPVAEPESWMATTVYGGDFDQDGRSDFIGTEGSMNSEDSSFFDVFYGGTWGETAVRVGTTSERFTACDTMDLLGDLDGDGAPEIHAEGHETIYKYIVSGADLAGADGQVIEDLAVASVYLVQDVGGSISGMPLYPTGDWTGDGRDDLLVWAPSSETSGERQHETFLVDGSAVSGEFFLSDAVGSWVGAPGTDGTYIGRSLEFDDQAGDELIMEDGEYTYIVPHETPTMRTEVHGIRILGTGRLHDRGPPVDLDADGYTDWFFDDLGADLSGVLLGWPVPWDEPQWWTPPS